MRRISVIAFPGAPNLPLFAAETQGFFADADLAVAIETTPSSVYQFKQFGTGAFDIAFTAFDNVVAYREGQGAAALDPIPDFRAIAGATQIELSFVTTPDIVSPQDVRGRSLALDAPGTGFAFVLYDMLARSGVERGSYSVAAVGATPARWQSVKGGEQAGTITIEPFTSIANGTGFPTLLKSTDMIPAYQGGTIAVRRDWAEAHEAEVEAFLLAYLRGLAWVLDPTNRQAGAALLAAKMPEIQPKLLDRVMASLLSPRSGLTPGAAILRDGAAAVLDLRSRYGGGETLSDVDRYYDLRWLERATAAHAADARPL